MSGCNSFFDVDPSDGLPAGDYYKNVNDLNGAAYGLYAPLAPEVHKLLLWGSARADMVTEGDGHDVFVSQFVNNQVSTLNPYTDYGFLYETIARCNHHLNNIPKVKPQDVVTPYRLNPFYGEAYFLRAWCYFQLVRNFKEVPLVQNEIAEQVTYVNRENDTVHMNTLDLNAAELRAIALQPAGKQEIWKLIISDLNKALVLLQPSAQLQWNPGFAARAEQILIRANLNAAYALACEVALWNRQYREASNFADVVLNYKTSVGGASTWSTQYTVAEMPSANYTLLVFTYQYAGAFNTNRLQEFTSSVEADGGAYYLKPQMEVCDRIFDESLDVRRRSSWMRVNRKDVIWKYIGRDEEGKAMREPYQSTAPWHLYHPSEVYLMKGIAENRLGNSGAAFEMLNRVRASRELLVYLEGEIPMDLISLEDMLFKEKARETAFEGKRWYDLLLMEEVFGRTGMIAHSVARKYPAEQQAAVIERLSDPENWYLPIEPERWK
jgi:hypothetical protein